MLRVGLEPPPVGPIDRTDSFHSNGGLFGHFNFHGSTDPTSFISSLGFVPRVHKRLKSASGGSASAIIQSLEREKKQRGSLPNLSPTEAPCTGRTDREGKSRQRNPYPLSAKSPFRF